MESFTKIFDDIFKGTGKVFKTLRESKAAKENIMYSINRVSTVANTDADVMKGVMRRIVAHLVTSTAEGTTGFRLLFRNTKNHMMSAVNVVSAIRLGNVEILRTAFRLGLDEITALNLKNLLRATYPDFQIAKYMSKINSLPTDKLYRLVPKTVKDMRVVLDASPEFKKITANIVDSMKKTKKSSFISKGMFLTILILAPTTSAVLYGLSEASLRSEGCWRIYMDGGRLKYCKSQFATCTDHATQPVDSLCRRYPEVHAAGICAGQTKSCTRCDSNASVDSPDYISPNQSVTPSDQYVCRSRPSLGEMLGQIAADLPDVTKDVFDSTTGAISSFFSSAKGIVYFLGFGTVVVLLLVLFLRHGRADDNIQRENWGEEEEGEEEENETLLGRERGNTDTRQSRMHRLLPY